VYEATAPAIPFLIELLEAPELEDRHSILEYLALLAHGHSCSDVHQQLSLFNEKKGTPAFQKQLKQEPTWVNQAREAVRAGRAIYTRLLEGEQNLVVTERLTCSGNWVARWKTLSSHFWRESGQNKTKQ
jgi:hypothetical protein